MLGELYQRNDRLAYVLTKAGIEKLAVHLGVYHRNLRVAERGGLSITFFTILDHAQAAIKPDSENLSTPRIKV